MVSKAARDSLDETTSQNANTMIIRENTKLGANTVIRDANGRELKRVKQFNTKTKDAVMYGTLVYEDGGVRLATVREKGNKAIHLSEGLVLEPVIMKVTLLGHYAHDKETNKRID